MTTLALRRLLIVRERAIAKMHAAMLAEALRQLAAARA